MPASQETNPTPSVPIVSIDQLADVLGYPVRWRMLRQLSGCQALTISELADAGGCSYASALGHLKRMTRAGVIVQGRGRLYQLPAQFLPAPGQPVVDFGHCVLRFNVGK